MFRINTRLTTFLCSAIFLIFPVIADNAARGQVDGWNPESAREELEPYFETGSPQPVEGSPTLIIRSNGKESNNGWWSKILQVRPGKYYEFHTGFQAVGVKEDQNRSILARVIWLDSSGKQAALPEYPATDLERSEESWKKIRGVYQAPEKAASAKLELVFRWASGGSVTFRGTSFAETDPPGPREPTVAAVHFRPRDSKSPRENLEKFAAFAAQAAAKKADIVLLPEGITLAGTGLNYLEASEPVPGPATEFMGEIAASHGIYIVANIYEREAEAVYNTSVLLDRKGEIAGKYRKVCLPREEIDGGLTPGDSFPVFKTDFGTIGLMTCWDVFFPEPARSLSQKGAEIIFLPIWGGNLDLARARAIENQVYLVSSTYDMKTGVFDREGKLIAEGTDADRVAVAKIDLNERKMWPWLGDFKSRIPREKPPSFLGSGD